MPWFLWHSFWSIPSAYNLHSYPNLLFVWQEFLLGFASQIQGTRQRNKSSTQQIQDQCEKSFFMVKSLKIGWWNHVIAMCASWNIFFPTRTLLHTYNRHDHHHHHHHHHHNHHNYNRHLYLHEGTKFATPFLNNMLIGVITPTISPWGDKIRHPLWTICWLG